MRELNDEIRLYDLYEYCEDNYDILVIAILLQAIKDYKYCLKRAYTHKEIPIQRRLACERELKNIEDFFRSQLYKMYSNLDDSIIINELERLKNDYRRKQQKLSRKS